VLLHAGVYEQASDRSAWFAWRELQQQGWAAEEQGGAVTLFKRGTVSLGPTVPQPAHDQPVFCQGWRDGRTTELQAPFWLYGRGPFTLTFTTEEPIRATIIANGETVYDDHIDDRATVRLNFPEDEWYPVILNATSPGLSLTVES
jgi:hypothetical protein